METQLEIKGLRFNDFDQQVCVMANVIKDNLSYWTTLFIDMTCLNGLINVLQRQNPEVTILDEIKSITYLDFTEYELELDDTFNTKCSLEELKGKNREVKLIRA